jgi:hypothetical protein
MSVRTWFMFATGLAEPLSVPVGTKAAMIAHVENIERVLGIKRTTFENNPTHWDTHFDKGLFAGVSDEVLCETVEHHNTWVRCTYRDFAKWSAAPVENGEQLAPADCELFWFGCQELTVPVDRWTRQYYVARMDHVYDVLRGRESEEGVRLDAPKLTPKQAAAVIRVFGEFIDLHDMRLDVPHGHDYLASSYDGGYDWCGDCARAMHPDDIGLCKRRKCELREELA